MTNVSVLVVEDSPTVARVIEGILMKHGYRVAGCIDTAEEALCAVEKLCPDIIFMDICLKGPMNGIEAAEIIAVKHKIPVIFLTSSSDTEQLEKALKSEGSMYLMKPVNEAELIFNLELSLQKARADKAIQQEKLWREAILESIIDGVVAEDINGNIIFMNTPAKKLLEVTENFKSLKIEDYAWFYDMAGGTIVTLDGTDRRLECQMKTLTGRNYYVILKIQKMQSIDGTPMGKAITITNITEERVMMERIRHLTFHDNLTDLYNRNFLEEELVRFNTARQYPLSIIMADLNGLKIMNDILGHNEGDLVLKACARLLKDCCRSEDIIARFGGDEFLIFLPNTNEAQAHEIVARISHGSQRIKTTLGPLSVALGSYTKESLDETIEEAVNRADERMYNNKTALKKDFYMQCFSTVYERLQSHDYEGCETIRQVKELLLKLARSCWDSSLNEEDLLLLADIYDIGMVCLPEPILEREALKEGDWEKIRRHTEMSYKIVNLNPDAVRVSEAVMYHHERWDGRGYPCRLKGDSIPLESRLLSVVDAYLAMRRELPYRRAMTEREALNEIAKGAGNQFDPRIVNQFVNIMDERL